MGASNAMAAYARYAGLVPPLSLSLLVYMALVSKDSDREPWFGQGHEALARFGMGRGRHAAVDESDIRAVVRAMKPLHDAGAITTDRRASVRRDGPSTARYRLNIDGSDARRIPSYVEPPPAGDSPDSRETETVLRGGVQDSQRRTVSGGSRRTVSGSDVGRFVVTTQDENRPTEEPRGTTRSENFKEEEIAVRTDVAVGRVPDPFANPVPSSRQPVKPHASGGGHRFESDGRGGCLSCPLPEQNRVHLRLVAGGGR